MVKSVLLVRVAVNSKSSRLWKRRLAIGALFACLLAGVGIADDRFYVMPNGQKVRLTKSANEYGLVLRSCDDAEACAKRLSAEGHGTLESFKKAPHSRVKLLRVPETTTSRKAAIRNDPAIQDVRPLYHFEGSDAPAVSTGTIALKLRPNVSDADREQLWKDHGITKAEPVVGQPRVYRLTPAGEEDDEVLLAELLTGDPRVQWAQPNFRRTIETRQITPSDTHFRLQWHLHNTGQLGGTVDADIDALEAWDITVPGVCTAGVCTAGTLFALCSTNEQCNVRGGGEGILIGMFDQACDVDHEDLRDNYSGIGQDATLESNAEGADDPRPKEVGDSHGTAVMGLAVATANNLGVRGVAHGAKFTASRAGDLMVTDVEIARAYTFARQQNVDVHINSWGFIGVPNPAVIADSIEIAFREGRNKGDLDGDGDDDPLGMVIVFASGNDGRLLQPGFELSMLPQVIGVGGSDDRDAWVCYSNFGTGIDVLAPTLGCFEDSAGMVTTDNTDGPNAIDQGYNVGGFSSEQFNVEEVDSAGKYTQYFSGTSAACPVAAGVAALVLSVNSKLSATDVRLILEHTTDKISPVAAKYNTNTSRSLKYGYGRINALRAVEAAQESLNNGGRTWPDRPGDLAIEGLFIRWTQNIGTDEYLVLQSESAFDFIPADLECYDAGQTGCAGAELRPLPTGVTVLTTHCNLACGENDVRGCEAGSAQCVKFTAPAAGKKWFFGIYARSSIGRYSYGVAADSNGVVTDSGEFVGGGDPGGIPVPPSGGPSVTISVTPLEGFSPLKVQFNGNAVSDVPIDDGKTAWDFDVDDGNSLPDATVRAATHTYNVAAGVTRTFVARLTMCDIEGRCGSEAVAIRVQGAEDIPDDSVNAGGMQIIVGLPGSPGSDVDGGTSPFSVVLTLDTTGLTGSFQSVAWDLGDGVRAQSLVVPHTYENDGDVALRIPIVATVTTISGATTISTTATRIITVQPGIAAVDPGDPNLPGTTPGGEGGSATPCSGVGMIPLILTLSSVLWMRRRY